MYVGGCALLYAINIEMNKVLCDRLSVVVFPLKFFHYLNRIRRIVACAHILYTQYAEIKPFYSFIIAFFVQRMEG